MATKTKSIRPFIGAQNFELSKRFYTDWGFQESEIAHNLSYFDKGGVGFYLQQAYVKDWVDNTMLFLEVEDLSNYWKELQALNLTVKYPSTKLLPIRELEWGKEFFLHDPSGILWHIGAFK